jgi:cellulose biosynthesis protein BcsQ
MPAVLVTNHKGAVGKTFVTVHLATCLAESGVRVLVVDCDGQYDAFAFFARTKPLANGNYREVNPQLALLANEKCYSLRALDFEEENFDYILIDCDARLADAAKNIYQNRVGLVLAPVNFQSLSIANLDELILTVGKLYGIDSPFDPSLFEREAGASEHIGEVARRIRSVAKSVAEHMMIVPLAADETALRERLKQYRVKTKVRIMKNMPRMLEETDRSLASGVPIWEVTTLSQAQRVEAKAYFIELAARVKQFFGF